MFCEVKSLSHVRLFETPWTVACQAPLSMEFPGKSTGVGCHFLLQGIFPREWTRVSRIAGRRFTIWATREALGCSAAAAKSLQSCPTLCDPIDSSPSGSRPWDSPGKNTGVGCHFLLQCMKVKSESEVVQSCPTLRDPMDCSLTGSSVYGISQARVLEWGAIAFSTSMF